MTRECGHAKVKDLKRIRDTQVLAACGDTPLSRLPHGNEERRTHN